MKRTKLSFACIGIAALLLTACEKKNDPTIPDAFPKKHLIEEFTGQGCGYCPNGMDCISDYIANDTNWIVVLHHYGYQPDKFSVAGSKTVTTNLGVSGAPSMTIDRAKTNYGNGKAVVFHPGYLPYTGRTQFETTTYASVNIRNAYDPDTRELTVTVSGDIAAADYPDLYLTVLVKESGMIDTQADYYKTYEGWQQFRHTNAVRAFLSDPTGDPVYVSGKHYSQDYTLTLNSKWEADNCMVVAFLSEDFKPVVQAEQCPVVAGTKGGADILHGGIKAVPVPDYYPEPGADKGTKDYSGLEADTLTAAQAQYQTGNGYVLWQLQAYNANAVLKVDNTDCIPFAMVYFFTELGQTTIQAGTYPLNNTFQPGTAYAGLRDDEKMLIDGSSFYYTSLSYFKQGYLVPSAQWLIVDGTLTIDADGWKLDGHARNGSEVHLVGTTPIRNGGKLSAPAKNKTEPKKSIFNS
jgi:hypothetical protein